MRDKIFLQNLVYVTQHFAWPIYFLIILQKHLSRWMEFYSHFLISREFNLPIRISETEIIALSSLLLHTKFIYMYILICNIKR